MANKKISDFFLPKNVLSKEDGDTMSDRTSCSVERKKESKILEIESKRSGNDLMNEY